MGDVGGGFDEVSEDGGDIDSAVDVWEGDVDLIHEFGGHGERCVDGEEDWDEGIVHWQHHVE